MEVTCPQCNRRLKASKEILGRQVKCPSCSKKFTLPASDLDTANVPLEIVATQDQTTQQPTRPCPFCGEEILLVAQKCKHCGEWLYGSHVVRPPGIGQLRNVGGPTTRIWPIKTVPVWNIPFFLFLTLNLYWLFWLYRTVRELHDRDAIEITPGKAVGFGFIPFYNLLWIFILWGKIGKALSQITLQNKLPQPAIGVVWLAPIGLLIGFICDLVVPFTGTLLNIVMLSIVLCTVQSNMNQIAYVLEGSIPR